jgi:hypothetical protein
MEIMEILRVLPGRMGEGAKTRRKWLGVNHL